MISELFAVVGAMGGVIGGFGGIVSFFSYRRSKLEALWQWAQWEGCEEVRLSRKYILYELDEGYDPKVLRKNANGEMDKIGPVMNAYYQIGILMEQGYIKKKFFRNNSAGQAIVNMYNKLEPIIMELRTGSNPYWGDGFTKLFDKIKEYYDNGAH